MTMPAVAPNDSRNAGIGDGQRIDGDEETGSDAQALQRIDAVVDRSR